MYAGEKNIFVKLSFVSSGFLALAIFIFIGFLTPVQRVNAQAGAASCLAAAIPKTSTAAGSGIGLSAVSVPVGDWLNFPQNTLNTGLNGAKAIKECLLDGLLTMLAKILIKQFTNSIVQWARSGFQGSPSFIQNPERFFLGVADIVAGQFIEQIAPMLCSPFRFQLNIGFRLGYNFNSSPEAKYSCTLSDVINNVEGFLDGDFFQGGFDGWASMTQNSRNNAYGAFIEMQGDAYMAIQTAQAEQRMVLDWGDGFRPVIDGLNNILTPGRVIESQLNHTLGGALRELELADEIDEIVGAVVGGLLTRVMQGAGGLAGSNPYDGARDSMGVSVTNAQQSVPVTNIDALLDETIGETPGGTPPPPLVAPSLTLVGATNGQIFYVARGGTFNEPSIVLTDDGVPQDPDRAVKTILTMFCGASHAYTEVIDTDVAPGTSYTVEYRYPGATTQTYIVLIYNSDGTRASCFPSVWPATT